MGDLDPILAMSGNFIVDTDNKLTDEQKKMLNEIRQKFDPVNVVADTCILYEVTDYKDESAADDFWEQYMDFFELGGEEVMIKDENLDERALEKDQRLNRQESKLRKQETLSKKSILHTENSSSVLLQPGGNTNIQDSGPADE